MTIFPLSARTGLYFILKQLVDKRYVDGWGAVKVELQRIARELANRDSFVILHELPWQKVFNFCERLHQHLAQKVCEFDNDAQRWVLVTHKSIVQSFIAEEIQRLFVEEDLAFECKAFPETFVFACDKT